ncbi:MAG: class I SAM-dependent methyltransferase [Acidimicrobiales bacterium]
MIPTTSERPARPTTSPPTVTDDAIGTTIGPPFEADDDQAALALFAHLVTNTGAGAVLDVGCGPGRATAFLHDLGLTVSGIDIAPAMVEAARTAHPHLKFELGALTSIPRPDDSLAGVVAWYSIIHTPLDHLAAAWRELGRVLRPGGVLLVAFQAGSGEAVVKPNAHGSGATLTGYYHAPSDIVASLETAGFSLVDDRCRAAVFDHETTPQAFLIAAYSARTGSMTESTSRLT